MASRTDFEFAWAAVLSAGERWGRRGEGVRAEDRGKDVRIAGKENQITQYLLYQRHSSWPNSKNSQPRFTSFVFTCAVRSLLSLHVPSMFCIVVTFLA